MAEIQRFKFITPRGVFIFPKLHEPDTRFKAEGEYSVKVKLPGDAEGFQVGREMLNREEIEERLTALLNAYVEETRKQLASSPDPRKKKKAKELKVRPIFTEHLDDAGEETGDIIIKAVMKASGVSKRDGKPWRRSPLVVDAKLRKLSPVPPIFGGSEGRVSVEVSPYYVPSDNVCGLTFYLEAVQVLKLVKGGERDPASIGFAEEDGFTADDAEATEFDDSGAQSAEATAADEPDEF